MARTLIFKAGKVDQCYLVAIYLIKILAFICWQADHMPAYLSSKEEDEQRMLGECTGYSFSWKAIVIKRWVQNRRAECASSNLRQQSPKTLSLAWLEWKELDLKSRLRWRWTNLHPLSNNKKQNVLALKYWNASCFLQQLAQIPQDNFPCTSHKLSESIIGKRRSQSQQQEKKQVCI